MRALLLALVVAGTGCTDTTLSENTAYRRLLDAYDSESECLASTLDPCYQTLTLCASGRVSLDLERRPMSGEYRLHDGSVAVAQFLDMSLEFDLEARTSPDLPGRHPWLQVTSLTYDCED